MSKKPFVIGIDEVGRAASKRRASLKPFVIGIDEVGRGSLAGPVVVAALRLQKKMKIISKNLPKLRDSKQLSARQRKIWFNFIKKHPKIEFNLAKVTPKIIDRINITQAANRAATKAVQKVIKINNRADIYLDGGLYLNGFEKHKPKTVIKGDEKIRAIKLASIVAKVSRDAFMLRLDKKYPHYGFKRHKGYGTKAHRASIKIYGPSKVHRLTFVRNIKKRKEERICA